MMLERITDQRELEARLIYSIIVAGKSAKFTDAVMKRLFHPNTTMLPFAQIRARIADHRLMNVLVAARTGNYGKLDKSLRQLVVSNLDLLTVTPADLERIHTAKNLSGWFAQIRLITSTHSMRAGSLKMVFRMPNGGFTRYFYVTASIQCLELRL